MLLEAKHTLDHAMTVHDLILAGKLELRMQHLEGLKSTLRTVEERRENLKAASAALSDAMERKEFKKCAQLQKVRNRHSYFMHPYHLRMMRVLHMACSHLLMVTAQLSSLT